MNVWIYSFITSPRPTISGLKDRTVYFSLIATLLLAPSIANAIDLDHKNDIYIPAQNLNSAIIELAKQVNISIAISSSSASNHEAPLISGVYSTQDALQHLLKGSKLEFEVVANVIVIRESAQPYTPIALPKSDKKENIKRYEEEVIVSIERRDTSLQYFAGTAASLSGGDLSSSGIIQLSDLNGTVKGLHLGNQDGNTEIYLRGIGSNNHTEIGDPAVATHLDDIYVPRSAALSMLLHDLERIEVSIGPQGTIRGRNATAGTINIIPNKPKLDALETALSTEVGNHGKKINTFVSNLPLLENTMSLRIAAMSSARNSYYKHRGFNTGIDLPGEHDGNSFRGQLAYKPVDDFKFHFSTDYNSENGTGTTASRFASALNNEPGIEYRNGESPHPITRLDPYEIVWATNISPSEKTQHRGRKMDTEYKFSEQFSIQWINSHRKFKNQINTFLSSNVYWIGQDITDPIFIDHNDRFIWDRRSHADTNEIRLVWEGDAIQWAAGHYIFDEQQATLLASTDDRSSYFFGQEFNNRMRTKSRAYYFDSTIQLGSALSVSGGVRITSEKKQRRGAAFRLDFPGDHPDLGNAQANRYGGPGWQLSQGLSRSLEQSDNNDDGLVNNADLTAEERFALWTEGVYFSPEDTILASIDSATGGIPADAFAPAYVHQSGFANYDYNDFRLRLAWQTTSDRLIYGAISTGHKSGGFNDQLLSPEEINASIDNSDMQFPNTVSYDRSSGLFVYKPEKLTAFEIGSKNRTFFGIVNASLFLYDYQDQQYSALSTRENIAAGISDELELDENSNSGDILFTYNIPKSEIYGAQIDTHYEFTSNFSVDLSLLMMRSRVKNDTYIIDSRYGANSSFEGNSLSDINWDFDGDGIIEFNSETFVTNIKNKHLPKAPELIASIGLEYRQALEYGFVGWEIDAQYQDQHFLSILNGRGVNEITGERAVGLYDTQEAYTTWNANIAFKHNHLLLEAYINNISNTRIATSQLHGPNTLDRWYAQPRNYGIRFSLYL